MSFTLSLLNPSLPGGKQPLTTDPWAQGKVVFQAHSILRTWKKSKCLETPFKGRRTVSGFGLLEQGTPSPEVRVH